MTKNLEKEVPESEEQLVHQAQGAVSQCNWVVGECAAKWTKRYARGRSDADFGDLVGLTGDQIYQRRRVFETFNDVHANYPGLKWSHFYAALNWDDAPECLQWAEENQATVAEMKTWRRAMAGDDQPSGENQAFEFVDFGGDPAIRFVPENPTFVRDPGGLEGQSRGGRPRGEGVPDTVAAVARESDPRGASYAPYRADAGSPATAESSRGAAIADRPEPEAAQLILRMATALERVVKALTPKVRKEFQRLPEKTRERFLKAVSELSETTQGM